MIILRGTCNLVRGCNTPNRKYILHVYKPASARIVLGWSSRNACSFASSDSCLPCRCKQRVMARQPTSSNKSKPHRILNRSFGAMRSLNLCVVSANGLSSGALNTFKSDSESCRPMLLMPPGTQAAKPLKGYILSAGPVLPPGCRQADQSGKLITPLRHSQNGGDACEQINVNHTPHLRH